jgi:arylsulfatase A-like enzyme
MQAISLTHPFLALLASFWSVSMKESFWSRRRFLQVAGMSTLLPLFIHPAFMANPGRNPNILWLLAEDLGPHLACLGTKEVFTPNLDRLAREGMHFTRAFTTAPVCSPSRSALITGMYQTTIGAHHHRSHRDDGYSLPSPARLLTDLLRDSGYFTLLLKNLPVDFGFQGQPKTDWNFKVSPTPFDSMDWADMKGHQPFYAQLNFSETHRPFKAPAWANPNLVEIPPYYPDHPVTRRDWAMYLDSLSELDRKIGRVLSQLEKEGLAENTLVVFFGDNGQAHVRGKQFCYDSGLHVPLILRWPRGLPVPSGYQAGEITSRLVASIDLAPTMLSLAGAEKPQWMQGEIFLGPRATSPRRYVFGARDRCDETPARFRSVRDSRYRYIRNYMPQRPLLAPNAYKEKQYPVWNLIKQLNAEGALTPVQAVLAAPHMPAEELYDLEKDPHETVNLAVSNDPENKKILERLRKALDRWIEESHDQGRIPEPKSVEAAAGVTKPGTSPNQGSSWEMPLSSGLRPGPAK